MPTPFLTPEAAGQQTSAQFRTNYINEIAIALKENWPASNQDPSDEQFRIWANQLVDHRSMTIGVGSDARTVPIAEIQTLLDPASRERLATRFGTSNLNEIILTREQLNATAEQLGQATQNNRGQFSMLGGATVMDAIFGFLEWVFGGFQGNVSDVIARRATHNMSSQAGSLLASNVPSVHAGVRNYIVNEYSSAIQQEAELIPRTAPRTLESVAVGSARSQAAAPQSPTSGTGAAPNSPAPTAGAGTASVTVNQTALRTQVTQFLQRQSGGQPVSEQNISAYTTAFERALTRVLRDNPSLQNSPQQLSAALAQTILNDTTTLPNSSITIGNSIRNIARASAGSLGGFVGIQPANSPPTPAEDATIMNGVPPRPGLTAMIQTALPQDLAQIVTITNANGVAVTATTPQSPTTGTGVTDAFQGLAQHLGDFDVGQAARLISSAGPVVFNNPVSGLSHVPNLARQVVGTAGNIWNYWTGGR